MFVFTLISIAVLYLALYIALSSVIICQYVGLQHYSNALGWVLLSRGVASLIAPPVSLNK